MTFNPALYMFWYLRQGIVDRQNLTVISAHKNLGKRIDFLCSIENLFIKLHVSTEWLNEICFGNDQLLQVLDEICGTFRHLMLKLHRCSKQIYWIYFSKDLLLCDAKFLSSLPLNRQKKKKKCFWTIFLVFLGTWWGAFRLVQR